MDVAALTELTTMMTNDDPESEDRIAMIPAPFDDLPMLDDPSDEERMVATYRLPPEAIPDEGAIPDPHCCARSEVELDVPEWALEAARYNLRLKDDPGEWEVYDVLEEHVQPKPVFRLPDGRDGVEVLLEEETDAGE